MVLTVHYEAVDLTETFLLADREEATHDGLAIYSPRSPLGTALLGAGQGDDVSTGSRAEEHVHRPSDKIN